MTYAYANFFDFGKSLNNNIAYTNDPANPLTYSIMPNYNTHFNHGPTAHFMSTYTTASTTYMKELAVGMHGADKIWNTYCQAYYRANPNRYWMNMGAINSQAFNLVNSVANPKNTVGQNLLRNALELYCIRYPSATFKQEQYDPNIANSPFINISTGLPGNCQAQIVLPADPDNDRLINQALQDPTACTDVLTYIWAAVMKKMPGHLNLRQSLKQSKLYDHLQSKSKYYEYWLNVIMNGLGEPCNCSKADWPCSHPY